MTAGWVTTTPSGRDQQSVLARLQLTLPLVGIWSAREFRVRYRQSALDVAWSVLQPISTVLIYGWLFAVVLDAQTGGVPYLSFAFAGITPWRFLSFSASAAFPSIVESHGTISKVYFPREVIPLSVVVASLVDLAIETAILLVLVTVQGTRLTETVVALLPIYAVLILLGAGVCVFGAALVVFVRDVNLALPILLMVLFVGSPIFYPVTALPESLAWLATVNPVAVLIEAIRACVLHDAWPRWDLLAVHGAAALVLFVASLWYMRAVDGRMADVA